MALPYITSGQLNKAIEEFKSSTEMFKVPNSEGTWIWCCINGKLQWARAANNSTIEINLPDSNSTSSESDPQHPESSEENPPENGWRVINLTRAEFTDGSDFHMRVLDLDKGTVTLVDMGDLSEQELAEIIAANTHKLCKMDGSFMVFESANLEQGVAMAYLFEQHGLSGTTTLPIDCEYGNAFANFEGSESSQMPASALGFNEVKFIATADYEDNSAEKNPDDIVFTVMYR